MKSVQSEQSEHKISAEDKNPLSLDNAAEISGGDELRDINSYEYLLAIYNAIEEVRKQYYNEDDPLPNLPPEFRTLNYLYKVFKSKPKYDPSVLYGNLYTEVIWELAKNGSKIKERPEDKNSGFFQAIHIAAIKATYINPNQALERSEKMMEEIVKKQPSKKIKEDITKRMKENEGSTKNKTTPQDQGSYMARFYNTFISSPWKSQFTTNMPSIRSYSYKLHRTDLPVELRFGTQTENPLFENFLEVQQLERKTNPPPHGKCTSITHIYFNNLGRDRTGMEGKNEAQLTYKLEELEDRHANVAVITLPADEGLMSADLIEAHEGFISFQKLHDSFFNIATGKRQLPTQDFFISNKIKKLLYGEDLKSDDGYDHTIEERVIKELLDKTFAKLGIDPQSARQLSLSEVNAIYFHFIKFELTNFIIDKLKPQTFNMSCKDAIDRGAVSSAYYNVLKSFEEKKPMTEEEFNRALHAAATLVKGRGMNHHAKVIWNAVNTYLNSPEIPSETKPAWMDTWRNKNIPSAFNEKVLESRLKNISDQITALGRNSSMNDDAYVEQIEKLLIERNKLIEDYFKLKGWEVKGQLLITRHPESKDSDKIYGRSPDATPSTRGVESLTPKPDEERKHASNFMHLLLRKPNKAVAFARSNMIRAGMLCNMIMESPEIKVKNCTNSRDFQETQGTVKAASTTPIPKDDKKKAFWRVENEELSAQRTLLSDEVNKRSLSIVKTKAPDEYMRLDPLRVEEPPSEHPNYISEKASGISDATNEEKFKAIDKLLKPNDSSDSKKSSSAWLIGHGKTSSNYFQHTFGEAYKFDFSTTKSVYLLRDPVTQKEFKFSPPGGIKINNDGRFEGVFRKEEHVLNSNDKEANIAKAKARKRKKNARNFVLFLITSPITISVGIVLGVIALLFVPVLTSEAKQYLVNLETKQIEETKKHVESAKTRPLIIFSAQEEKEKQQTTPEYPSSEPSSEEEKKNYNA